MTDAPMKGPETTAPPFADPPFADTVWRWWSGLQEDPRTKRPADRATLAELRRARGLSDVVMIPAFQELWRRVGRPTAERAERLALAAAVVAHVRVHSGVPFARQLGPRDVRDATTATLSPLRLRRVLAIDDGEAEVLRTALIRLVKHAGGVANVRDLADSALYWTEKTRIAWAFAYWNGPQPGATSAEDAKAEQEPEPTGETG
ncbi:MAG: type I-E CRISPR-associated protein Cse2/CasB [Alphaproteobacteria bacterium]|nr:type I-E CRISPR-associated protein Cse2/CasB [Alphaproteobacteria bacterium]